MAIRYYDQAVSEVIKKWIKDPNMTVLKPDESSRLFQQRADQANDKPLTLPLIAISRDNDMEIISTAKKALTYDGAHIAATKDKSKILNGIPVKISYQLDIYTRYFAEADEYMRNFVFQLINYPKVSIEIPYNDSKIIHNFTMLLESSVSDNSNIPEKLVSGQFTRMTLKFTIDDAYLFSIPFMDNWSINEVADVIIKEKEN